MILLQNDFIKTTSSQSDSNVGLIFENKLSARQQVLVSEMQTALAGISALNADIAALTKSIQSMSAAVSKECTVKDICKDC